MINNIELIKPLLNFEKAGDFYMLYVFKRKKDQPEGERDNHQSVRTIKTYCIESIDHLDRRWDEIVQMCEMFKARAYIHIQKQNHFDVSLNMMVALAQRIQDGNTNQKGLFDSVVGQIKTQEKRWIVDIDTKDEIVREEKQVLVTQGFIGGTSENFTTTLGREGSDYSAAIFASWIIPKENVIYDRKKRSYTVKINNI
jgi:hypothetical protein